MLLSSKIWLFFLFITVVNARPNNYFLTNNETSSNDLISDLSADSSNPSVQQISDDKVKLLGYYGQPYGERAELILLDRSLDVEIDLHNCNGRVSFCFSSTERNPVEDSSCPNNFCEFRVEGKRDEIDLTQRKNVLKIDLDHICDAIHLKHGHTFFCGLPDSSCEPLIDNDNKIKIIVKAVECPTSIIDLDHVCDAIHLKHGQISYCGQFDGSCEPLIDDDNKIKIIVKAVECSTSIRRAKIYVEPPPTTTSLPSIESSSPGVSAASIEWYIWIIVVGILLFIVGIIIGVVFCWKKRICIFKKEAEVKKKITITDTLNSTIITKDENVLKADLQKPPPAKPTLETIEETPPPPPKVAKKLKKKSGKISKKSKKAKKEKKDVIKDTVDDATTPTSAPPPSFIPVKSYIPPVQGLTQEQVLEEDFYLRKPNKERLRMAK
uniref:Uncharacterized protein n=1 Tax=Panagrolaimus sp. ES5 TaxID=591445 RepID=A0AC34G6L9_9BILA